MLIVGLAAIAGAIVAMAYLLLGKSAVVTAEGGDWTDNFVPAPITTKSRDDADEIPTLSRRMQSLAKKFTPADYSARLQHKLDLAGNPRNWGPDRVLALKGFGLLLGLGFGALIGLKHGIGIVAIAAGGLGAFGLFVPDTYVRILGERRQVEVQKGLPDVMDMLTICVEAGLGFDAALGRVARNLVGPMPEECSRVLQEMQFGKSRSDALRALVDRTNVSELRTFVSAMVQAAELGISIGSVLREQAKEMRIRRRQRAEEKAQKLQVKILAPLILCLLPCIFIVVIGPAAIKLVGFFGKVNA